MIGGYSSGVYAESGRVLWVALLTVDNEYLLADMRQGIFCVARYILKITFLFLRFPGSTERRLRIE